MIIKTFWAIKQIFSSIVTKHSNLPIFS